MVLSGAKYTVGRELTTEYMGEDGSIPVLNETGTQSFVFPFCVTGTLIDSDESDVKTPFPDFETYYQEQLADYFSLGSWSGTGMDLSQGL